MAEHGDINLSVARTVFFDLDDTLYDQLEPFRRAVAGADGRERESAGVPLEDLFKRVRHYSDRLWTLHTSGKLGLEELRIERLIRAFRDFGIPLTEEGARELQARYIREQNRITPFTGVEEAMAKLRKHGFELGVITNGPVEHQKRKLRALGLETLFAADRIFVSDALGVAKPDPDVFRRVNRLTGTAPQTCWYVGDSWENDVAAARNAGWHTIWFNHRGKRPESDHTPDLVIRNYGELILE